MPSNARFASVLSSVFLQQSRELWSKIDGDFIRSGKRVNLSHWADDPKVINAILPFLVIRWQQGLKESAAQMSRAGKPVDTRHIRTEMLAEAKEQARKLLRETAKTTQDAVNAKLREARRRMRAGKPGLIVVQREIEQQLRNKTRAEGIADTETETAHNAGSVLVYAEGEAGWKEWEVDGPEACPQCHKLNGKIVRVDEPFWVNPKGGPYAVVMHPTLHPFCRCRVKPNFSGPGKRRRR